MRTNPNQNELHDIDPALIDAGGIEDRLEQDAAAHRDLCASIAAHGQQIPVLLRPHPGAPGRYQIVCGRRRLRALRELGLPVRAQVRTLDDQALILAQGQENSARRNLSFIERAAFAAQLQAAGYARQTIADALSIDLPMASRLLKVGTAFDIAFLRAIGAAPGIGRARWMRLARAVAKPEALARARSAIRRPEFLALASDDRFEMVLTRAEAKTARAAARPHKLPGPDGAPLAAIRVTTRTLTLTVPARLEGDFGTWLAANAEALVADLHDRWRQSRP